jgi:hypothetical protein
MKAEHRKELETNILADRMGRVLRGTKETSTTAIWYWVVGIGLALLVTFLIMRWFNYSAEISAKNWALLESGEQPALDYLAKLSNQNVAKAARFQLAFENLWVRGIRELGGNTGAAKNSILDARDEYERLAKECQYDPFLGEALYGLAVIEETAAIEDTDKLKTAVTAYKRVVKEAKDSAFAKLAQDRLDVLDVPAAVDGEDAKTREEREIRETKLREIIGMYNYMKNDLRPRGLPGLPGMQGMDPAQQKKFLDEIRAKHPEWGKPPVDVKLPEITAPDVKAPDGKVPDDKTPKTPDGKTPAPDAKTPAAKGPDGKEVLPTIAPPPPAPIPPAPGANAPAPTTPDAKTDDKKSDKK